YFSRTIFASLLRFPLQSQVFFGRIKMFQIRGHNLLYHKEISLRSVTDRMFSQLLRPKCQDRIDLCCSPTWNVTGQYRDQSQEHPYRYICQWIAWMNSKEQARH